VRQKRGARAGIRCAVFTLLVAVGCGLVPSPSGATSRRVGAAPAIPRDTCRNERAPKGTPENKYSAPLFLVQGTAQIPGTDTEGDEYAAASVIVAKLPRGLHLLSSSWVAPSHGQHDWTMLTPAYSSIHGDAMAISVTPAFTCMDAAAQVAKAMKSEHASTIHLRYGPGAFYSQMVSATTNPNKRIRVLVLVWSLNGVVLRMTAENSSMTRMVAFAQQLWDEDACPQECQLTAQQ
jgi:hypothetical protein